MTQETAALRKWVAEAYAPGPFDVSGYIGKTRESIPVLLDAIEALTAANAEMRAALEDAARKIEARSEIYTSEEQMCEAIIAHCRALLARKP